MDFKKNDIVRLREEYFEKIKSGLFFLKIYSSLTNFWMMESQCY